MRSDAATVEVDPLFDVLASRRRRLVLAVLRARGGPLDVDELGRSIARCEGGYRSDGPSEPSVGRVRLDLHHAHVPKLESAGLLTRDDRAGTVERVDLPPRFETSVELATAREREVAGR